MITIPGTMIAIPAVEVERRPSRDEIAWLGSRITVRLTGYLEAARAHVGAGEGATARDFHSSAGTFGSWYAIGDTVQTRSEFRRSHSLPSASSTKMTFFRLLPGTTLNIGRCSSIWGGTGGGGQAEWLEGPLPHVEFTFGALLDRLGHA
jgi:hypothetical protein